MRAEELRAAMTEKLTKDEFVELLRPLAEALRELDVDAPDAGVVVLTDEGLAGLRFDVWRSDDLLGGRDVVLGVRRADVLQRRRDDLGVDGVGEGDIQGAGLVSDVVGCLCLHGGVDVVEHVARRRGLCLAATGDEREHGQGEQDREAVLHRAKHGGLSRPVQGGRRSVGVRGAAL